MNKQILFVAFGLFILFGIGFVSAVQAADCKNFYWFDDDNRECGQKEFCGAYMYYGLQTFASKTQCQNALNDDGIVCTQEAKQCDDGNYVSRNSSNNCKFDRCLVGENEENNSCTQDSDCVRDPCQKNKCVNTDNVLQTFAACPPVKDNLSDSCKCVNNKCRGYKEMSNGRKAEIKIMPSTASLRARERLGELGFNVTLKEVGDKIVYDVSAEKEGKILGLFKMKGKVTAEVDAETGEVVKVKKPWWSFMASGI